MSVNVTSQPGASGRLPTAPDNVTATAVSGGESSTGSASVSWTASSNPGRETGTYVVRSYDSSNNPGPTASVSASATSVSVTGLTIGMDYTFKVELQSPYGLNSNQSSATASSIRAFRRPTIGGSTKGAGTAVSPTGLSHTGKNNTWGRTSGSTTTTATNAKNLSFSKVSGAGSPTLTTSGNDCNITGMAEDSTYNIRATWENSRASGVRITTSVNPEGRATTISLSWGYSSNYTTYNATSSGSTTVNIGNGSSAVTTEWTIDDSGGSDRVNTETLYFRVTATNSVDTARTSDDTHTTVATSTYSSDTGSLKTQKLYNMGFSSTQIWSLSTYKDAYHANPYIENILLIAGGGSGGRDINGYYAGGGGGGAVKSPSAFTATGNLHIYVGAGGAAPSSAGSNGANGGDSSIYNYATATTQVSATGGGYGYAGGDFWGYGGFSGKGRESSTYDGGNTTSSIPAANVAVWVGGGGGGQSTSGGSGDAKYPDPVTGGGGSGSPNGAGGASIGTTRVTGGGYDTLYPITASGGATGGGSSVSGGAGGSGTAGTGGGGAAGGASGTSLSPTNHSSGAGGSGYVSFSFYGK